jgi:hypothetical protein
MPNETRKVNVTSVNRVASRVRKRFAHGVSSASRVQHRLAKSNCDAVQIVNEFGAADGLAVPHDCHMSQMRTQRGPRYETSAVLGVNRVPRVDQTFG